MTCAEPPRCIEQGDDCHGEVLYRESLTGTGTPIVRCDHHWAKRLERETDYRQFDSPVPPPWFDPLAAGERWNDDDPWP